MYRVMHNVLKSHTDLTDRFEKKELCVVHIKETTKETKKKSHINKWYTHTEPTDQPTDMLKHSHIYTYYIPLARAQDSLQRKQQSAYCSSPA